MSYNEWLDVDVLEDYLDGKLDAKTMHRVEKLSLEDPFVAEALAGLSQSPRRTVSLSLLQKQLKERVAEKPVIAKRWRLTSHRLSIAAAAAVLFITVSLFFFMKENKRQELASKRLKKSETIILSGAKPESKIGSTPDQVATLAIDKTSTKAIKKNSSQMVALAARDPQIASDTLSLAIAATTPSTKIGEQVASVRNDDFSKQVYARAEAVRKAVPIVAETALSGKVAGITLDINSGVKTANMINGHVYAKGDGLPLPGAVVKINGSSKATTTNSKGEFALRADSANNQRLSVAYLGFNTSEVSVNANEAVTVQLAPATNSLNEVVVAKREKDKRAIKWSGQVIEKSNGLPVVGATIFSSAKRVLAETDFKGNFVLNIDSAQARELLTISYPGLKTKSIRINAEHPAVVVLDEEILTPEMERQVLSAENASSYPDGGFPSFALYLKNNNKLFKGEITSQYVIVNFGIRANGRPINIKIIKGLSPAENEEAIRLIKNGPSWKLKNLNVKTGTTRIYF